MTVRGPTRSEVSFFPATSGANRSNGVWSVTRSEPVAMTPRTEPRKSIMTTPLPRSTDSVPDAGEAAHASEPVIASTANEQTRTRSFRIAHKYRHMACDRDERPVRRLLAALAPLYHGQGPRAVDSRRWRKPSRELAGSPAQCPGC